MGASTFVILNKKKETHNVILFLHIPKTAGGTLHTIFDEQYKNYCDVWIKDKPERPVNRIPWSSNLPIEEKKRIEIVKGHFKFGIHKNLPQENFTYLTMLRNPIEQVVSNYYYIKHTKHNPLHNIINTISLYEFINESRFHAKVSNIQTRYIAGSNNKDDLELAKYNLINYFSIVGITERFDDTLKIISQVLGWEKINDYKKINVISNRPSINEIPNEIIEIIREKNQKDFQLYELGKQLFYKQFKALKKT